MTENMLSLLRSAGPPIANHFWQSTAFVAAIGLLVLLFDKNYARVRSLPEADPNRCSATAPS